MLFEQDGDLVCRGAGGKDVVYQQDALAAHLLLASECKGAIQVVLAFRFAEQRLAGGVSGTLEQPAIWDSALFAQAARQKFALVVASFFLARKVEGYGRDHVAIVQCIFLLIGSVHSFAQPGGQAAVGIIFKIVDHVFDWALKDPGAMRKIVRYFAAVTFGTLAVHHQRVASGAAVIVQRDGLFHTVAAEYVPRPVQPLTAGKAGGREDQVNSRLPESSQRL